MTILSRLRTEPDSLGAGCALLLFCFGLRIAGEVPYIALTTGRYALFALLEFHDGSVVLSPTFLFGLPGYWLLYELWPRMTEWYEAMFVARALSFGICLTVFFLVAWRVTWACCRWFRFETTPRVVGSVLARRLGVYLLLDLGLHGLAFILRLETPSFVSMRDVGYWFWYAAPWLLLAGMFPWVAARLRVVAGAPVWKGTALATLSLAITLTSCGVLTVVYLAGWMWLYPRPFIW